MAWIVKYDSRATKELAGLDKAVARRIVDYLKDVANSGDPTSRGKRLTGPMVMYWCYRIGDYRAICEHHHEELMILTIQVGHRSKAYD